MSKSETKACFKLAIRALLTTGRTLRHPYELGGLALSLSMVWAQFMPFVAVILYDGDEDVKNAVTTFLADSTITWT